MAEIFFCSAAQEEYADALVWYAEHSYQIAEDFENAIENALKDISLDPERFPKCDPKHHFYLVRRFPFQIIYQHENDCLTVISITHTARDIPYGRDH